MQSRSKPWKGIWRATLFACLFLSQLVLAVFIHSDTQVARRVMSRWISGYLSEELRGTFDLGTIERLSTSRAILRNAVAYDEQHRRIATFERIAVEANAAKALLRWVTRTEPLTLIVDSVRADGVRLRLHPSPNGGPPTLLTAIETAVPASTTTSPRPFRVFLSNIELGDVSIDSTFSEFTTNSLRMRQVAGQLLVNQHGVAASLKRFSLDLDEPISLPVHAFGSLEFRSPRRVWGDVSLELGQIPCSLHVEYEKNSLKLEVHPFKVTPEAARQWFAEWPLRQTATLTLSAHGPLGELGVRSLLRVDSTDVEAVGRVSLVPSLRADLAVLARSFDVKALLGAPFASNLDAAARLSLEVGDASPRLHFDGMIHPGIVAALVTPRIDVEGQYDAEGLVIGGRSSDAQLPIRAAMVLRNQELQLDAQIDRAQLHHIVPKPWTSDLSGSVKVRTQARIKGDVISAEVNATASNLRTKVLSVRNAKVVSQFEGPLSSPEHWHGSLQLDCEGTTIPPYFAFDRVSTTVTGSPNWAHLQLDAQQAGVLKLSLSTELHPFDEPTLAETRVQLARNDQSLSLTSKLISLSNQSVMLEGLRLDGSAGQIQGNLGFSNEDVFGTLEGQSVDLTAIAQLLGLPGLSGETQFALDVDTRRRPAEGHAQVRLIRAGIGRLKNITGALDFRLNDDLLYTSLRAASDIVGEVSAAAELKLGGSPMRLPSYQRATGKVDLELLRVKLDQLVQLLGGSGPRLRGNADLRLSAERRTAAAPINWSFSAGTNGFGLSGEDSSQKFDIGRVDLLAGADFVGDTNELRSNWVIHRDHQPKASLALTATMPPMDQWWEAFVHSAAWRSVPLQAFLSVPRQNLSEWSEVFSRPLGSGSFESRLSFTGPIDSANFVLELRAKQLLLQDLENATPLDLEGILEHTSAQTRVLMGLGNGQSPWAQINGVGRVQRCPDSLLCVAEWSGRAEIGFLGLPIGVIPGLAQLGLGGELRGVLTARREAGLTSTDAVLPVDNLRVSGQPLGQALLHLRSAEDEILAGAKLLDASAQIDLEVHVPIQFRTLLPVRRSDSPIRMVAAATGYDAAVLSPWLDEYVDGLSGELNGRLDVTLGGAPSTGTGPEGVQAATGASPELAVNGYMTLDRGKGVLRSLGLSFSDLAVAAQASSTGSRTTISVPTISLSTGDEAHNLRGSAVAELETFSLKRLTARVDAAKQVPLPVNSVTVATLSGAADVELTRASHGFDVTVDFDDLEVHLPRSSSRQVVGLRENPDVVVLQPLGPEAWRKTRSQTPTEYRVRFSLGSRARVTRADLALPIAGTPELKLSETARPSGIIQLGSSGRLELFGKSFVIDRGRVTLDPDNPTNPQFDVVAIWRGPTHVVTAHLQGTLEQAKLRLTSDPPLPSEARVMALLLGGGSGNDSSAGAGLGVGATLFNEFLSGTALSSVEVRTSTGDRHANYTAAVPLRENLWFEATYQSPTNSTLPGATVQRGFSGTVDYRFRRNWSVRTEVGTLGAGADLLWQYRY